MGLVFKTTPLITTSMSAWNVLVVQMLQKVKLFVC